MADESQNFTNFGNHHLQAPTHTSSSRHDTRNPRQRSKRFSQGTTDFYYAASTPQSILVPLSGAPSRANDDIQNRQLESPRAHTQVEVSRSWLEMISTENSTCFFSFATPERRTFRPGIRSVGCPRPPMRQQQNRLLSSTRFR